MRIIDIEAHWTTEELDRAVRKLAGERADPSLALNDRGDIPDRLLDLDEKRIAAMDAAGVAVQIVSLSPPGAHALTGAEAAALSREANDRAGEAVSRHPTRLAAMTTLPMADPDAALAELQRVANVPGQVAIMSYGRSGARALDDPINDELLAAAAALRRPIFVHPQVPPVGVRDASYAGFEPIVELGLATFGWGWHTEAALAVLRLIVRGTFDRHPDLQIVLGHWGELLLFWLDRIDSLSGVAGLERRVPEYFQTNIHVASSGMLAPRLVSHALSYTNVDRILFSGDYPFHQLTAPAITKFLAALPTGQDAEKLAHANAEALFDLAPIAQPRHLRGGT